MARKKQKTITIYAVTAANRTPNTSGAQSYKADDIACQVISAQRLGWSEFSA